MSTEEEPLDKVLTPENLNKIGKILETMLPLLDKITAERTAKLLSSINIDAILQTLDALSPTLTTLTSPDSLKVLTEIDFVSLLRLAEKFTELQKSGTLDQFLTLIDVFKDKEFANAVVTLISKLSEATKAWYEELPRVKPVSPWGLLGALGDKNAQYAMGALIAYLRELGRQLMK
ncbi:MAG: DUF1641 domain-containing protein [Sulfolobaceae archaeon]|nr:DUF1641 domain-containing protein [Sulfolobaceae archaeon]